MFVFPLPPPHSCVAILNPQCDDIRRQGLWAMIRPGGWGLHEGISALRNETPETPQPFCYLSSQKKAVIDEVEVGPHQTPNLQVPGSVTVRNKHLLFSRPVYARL